MVKQTLIRVAILLVVTLSQGLVESSLLVKEKLDLKRQLDHLNKPSIKSFTTKHGEILDCVEIHKQLALDHPLLRNHSIQRQYNRIVTSKGTKQKNNNNSTRYGILSQLLPKDMICPKGSVMVKRIVEEDLHINKIFSSLQKLRSKASKFGLLDDDDTQETLYDAYQTVLFENTGVGGMINIWNPEVAPDQFSSASITVGTHDGPKDQLTWMEFIEAGWAVIPSLYPNNATRLFTYWTRDNGETTGCYNAVCEGFVHTERTPPPGIMLDKISTYDGRQYVLDIKIKQDKATKNWLLYVEDEVLGYWPKELFGTLGDGAEMTVWGGEIMNEGSSPTPAMGSGHFPEEGFGKASFIKNLEIFSAHEFPKVHDLRRVVTNDKCYRYSYKGNVHDMGHTIYFGGPPNCQP